MPTKLKPGRLASADGGSAGIFGIVAAQWRVFSWRGPANGTDPATTYRRRAEETGEPGEGEIDLKA